MESNEIDRAGRCRLDSDGTKQTTARVWGGF
jgi:hypothetical protein